MESCQPNHSHCLHQDANPRGPRCCWCGAFQHGEHASGNPVGPVQFVPTPVYPNPYWPRWPHPITPLWGGGLFSSASNAIVIEHGGLVGREPHGLMAGPSDH